ncbi:MAG TPA: tetratricopeptide repeat protein [Gammaproteobacteria bacterium]|nr:tetratricopeptide repeat protein [Gammaproteobacteria bacterium]
MLLVALCSIVLAGCAQLDRWQGQNLRARGDAAYEAGHYREAARVYRRYLELRDGDPQAYYRLGNSESRLGHLRQAQRAYDRTLSLDPTFYRAQHNLGLVHMQLAWKNLLEARRHLPEADAAAADTMHYLGCLMETFMGYPEPSLCRGGPNDEDSHD